MTSELLPTQAITGNLIRNGLPGGTCLSRLPRGQHGGDVATRVTEALGLFWSPRVLSWLTVPRDVRRTSGSATSVVPYECPGHPLFMFLESMF